MTQKTIPAILLTGIVISLLIICACFASLNRRVETHSKRLEAHFRYLEAHDKRQETLYRYLDVLSSRLDTASQRIDLLQKQIDLLFKCDASEKQLDQHEAIENIGE